MALLWIVNRIATTFGRQNEIFAASSGTATTMENKGISLAVFLREATKASLCSGSKRHVHMETTDLKITSDSPIDSALLDAEVLDAELPGLLGRYPLPADAVLVFRNGKTTVARLQAFMARESVSERPKTTINVITIATDAEPDSDNETVHESSDAGEDDKDEEEGEQEETEVIDDEEEDEEDDDVEPHVGGDGDECVDDGEDSDGSLA